MLATAVIVVCADQFTKSWARQELVDGRVIDVVGPLQLSLAYNRGIAFGLGDGMAPILVTVAMIAFVAILVARRIDLVGSSIVGVGLILGGAIGNLSDRIFRDTGGAVVDFIKIPWWPVFNVADTCIVAGALLLLLAASRDKSVRQLNE